MAKVIAGSYPEVGLPQLFWLPSPNFSSRGSAPISMIVIHDTEGVYNGAVNWFSQFRSHVSAHLVLSADGTQATQMVAFGEKAWHACWFNGRSIGIEMAGFESKGFSESEWGAAAAITAYLCHRFNIPVRWAQKGQGAGIARHYDLGMLGGGHIDPTRDDAKMLWFMGLVAKASATAATAGGWPAVPWGH